MSRARKRVHGILGEQGGFVKGLLVLFAGAFGLFLLQTYVVQVFRISTASMAPTLLPDDLVVVARLSYLFHAPRPADVIAFHFPQADGREFVKRVIGVPGDVVEEGGGRISVNGKAVLPEGGAGVLQTDTAMPMLPPRQIPPGQVFVLGDNQPGSLDSRYWGTVPFRDVVGRVVLVCWSSGKHWWDVRWHRIGRPLQ